MTKIEEITVGSYISWAADDEYYNDLGQKIESVLDDDYIANKSDVRYLYMGRVVDVGKNYVFIVNERINVSPKRYIALSQKDLDNINFEITDPSDHHTFPDLGGSTIKLMFNFDKNDDGSISPKHNGKCHYDYKNNAYNFVDKGLRFHWFYEISDDYRENVLVPFQNMTNKLI